VETLQGLYRKEGARLWRTLLAFTGDREVANDSIVEAFAQARGRKIRRPSRWVWRTAFRIAAHQMGARARYAGRDPPEGFDAFLDREGLRDPSGLLLMGLRRLAPKQRAALVLRYHAGLGIISVARIADASTAILPLRLAWGRWRLRRLLRESNRRLRERFATLDRVPAPDLWPGIERRDPADLSLGFPWARFGMAVLVLVLAAAAVAFAWALAGRP